jgi:hypothetical protein
MKNQNIFWQVAAMALSGLITCCGGSNESQTLEAWDLRNNPFGFDARVVSSLSDLPLAGKIKVLSWSDTYWPSMRGGVAARWRNWIEDNFTYQPPSREQILSMSVAEKANLSPAEKYDAFLGRFDYPLVQSERSRTSPDRPAWEGLCHGWSVASLNFAEPKPVLLKSPNGLEIPFGSSDIKGLLTLMQGNFNYSPSKILGGRCNLSVLDDPSVVERAECRDLNAGAFHIILANFVGIAKKGFILDITWDQQVWNHPVTGYSSKIGESVPLSANSAPGAVRAVTVETTILYTIENVALWQATNGTPNRAESKKIYSYKLELNSLGQIVGGEWLTSDHPDFLWMQGTPAFKDYFAPLQYIYRQSLVADPYPDPNPVDTAKLAADFGAELASLLGVIPGAEPGLSSGGPLVPIPPLVP